MLRAVVWLIAINVVVLVTAVGVLWHGERADLSRRAKLPVSTATVEKKAVSPPSHQSSAPPAPGPAPTAAPSAEAKPTFDIVRIGPDGRAVIAGRAQPGAKVVLLDGEKEIARTRADQDGGWVLIAQDPPLGVGQHELRVQQHIEGRLPITSDRVVVAVVPKPPADAAQSKESTLVMIAASSGLASLVQVPPAAGLPKSADLQMSTLDYDEDGRVTISGHASAGTMVRAYVDDKMVAEGQTDIDGRWRLAPADSVAAGQHKLRLELLAKKDGPPVAHLELPFERIVVQRGVGDTRQLVVVQGDSLWNIARAHYGTGFHYTLIFGANRDQIRNPDLIYPGQVFNLPKAD